MRRATISWVVAALGVALIVAGIAINPGRLGTTSWLLLIAPPFIAVGRLLAAKRSENPIGWLFLGFGFAAALDFAVVADTMQPRHVSLWLRKADR